MPEETTTQQETQFVLRRLEEALRFFGREIEPRWFWILVLIVVLAAAFAYVVVMYRRDSRSVGWPWATFLGLLRCTVYVVLAAVFLLPSLQTWEKTETRSKDDVLFDVSESMLGTKDDMPTKTTPVEKLPSRQDKVIQFLTDDQIGFLRDLKKKNPVDVYRFGSRLDPDFQRFEGEKVWSPAEWASWLKPNPKEPMPDSLDEDEKAKFQKRLDLLQQLVGGTNIADSAQELLNKESTSMVQGIIVISDGRSTQYSSEAFEKVINQAHRAKVPIFTVVVGEHRQPIRIIIQDLQAPEQARPDDKFPLRVEVDGEGLPNRDKEVTLEVTTAKGDKRTLTKSFKFNAGAGGPPHAQIEFEIDAAALGVVPATGKKPELDEGEYVFQARIAKDDREIFIGREHVSEKARVRIVKRPLRVLLFADAATRDYQFVRNLMVREVDNGRVDLSICLQKHRDGVIQDVPPEKFLQTFPTQLGEDAGDDKAVSRYSNLAQYDLIIAFDPDWNQLQPEQMAALDKWVYMHAGGLILVAGPVNTNQLARPSNRDAVRPLLNLFPVILADSVLQGLGVGDRKTTDPWRLNFPGATAELEFLKLDEESKEPMAGWEEFFTGRPKAESSRDAPITHGFYSFYPVESVKPSAAVVATFADQRAVMKDGKEQPYLVTMPYGSGKVVYLGSGETWRLRQYREIYHERFWTKLTRYAGSGNLTRLSRRGQIVLGQQFTVGQSIHIEAQLLGRDLRPLSDRTIAKAQIKPPPTVPALPPVELRAKAHTGGEWAGWFEGNFRVMAPGEYRAELQVPEGGDLLSHRFMVKESNPELDNTRPDFGQMYQLASEMTDVLPRIKDKKDQEELKQALQATAARLLQQHVDAKSPEAGTQQTKGAPEKKEETTAENSDVPRLFFDLNSAHLIPKCMKADSKTQRSRGPVKDFWDEGFTIWRDPTMQLAWVLLLVTILLSIEWLTRKLLKLA